MKTRVTLVRTTCLETMAGCLKAACAAWLLPLLLLLAMPAWMHAQYNFTTTNGTITITKYTGSSGAVTIPIEIGGLPVISIGNGAFQCSCLASVSIPNSVTSIGDYALMGSG